MTLSPVYPDRIIEAKLNDVWTDITSYVLGEIGGDWGISGHSPIDKVAKTGNLNITLNNQSDIFSPNRSTALSGWKKGIPIRLKMTLEGFSVVRWKGYIDNIKIPSGDFGDKRAIVKCIDWMGKIATYPLEGMAQQINKKADEGITAVVGMLPLQPDNTDLSVGTDTFATIFDTANQNTKALSEFAKLTLSEFGFLYLKKDRLYGETLRFESRHDRDFGKVLDALPVSKYNSALMGQESGFKLRFDDGVDGAGFDWALDESQTIAFNNNFIDLDLDYGNDVINSVTTTQYPRYVDPATSTLYNLDQPILIIAGQTLPNIKVSYTDAFGKKISGANLITPIITTDYKMYQNQNETGTNLSSSLVVDVTLGTDGAIFNSLTNSSGTDGYITFLRIRGQAVYTYNSVSQFARDDDSILLNGLSEVNIEQKYNSGLISNNILPNIILQQEKTAKTRVERIHILGNSSYESMIAFMLFDVGSVFQLIETHDETNGYYFIQDVKFTIDEGGIVNYSWGLKFATTLSDQYWQVGVVGFSEVGQTTYVSY